MASKWEDGLGVAVVGMAVFQIASLWQNTAPELADMRKAPQGDITMKQHLLDADITVGLVTVGASVAIAVMTHNITAMLLMLFTFGVLSWYYHQVLKAEPR